MDSKDDVSSQKRKAITPIFSLYGSDDEDDKDVAKVDISGAELKRTKPGLHGEPNSVLLSEGSNTSGESSFLSFFCSNKFLLNYKISSLKCEILELYFQF